MIATRREFVKASYQITDKRGNALLSRQDQAKLDALNATRHEIAQIKRTAQKTILAKYDAAQTSTGNENHWQWADNLNPHAVASLKTRRTLRSRSRYELIENNPFLKGIALTLSNDFVGSGPKLVITDSRIPKGQPRRAIELKWNQWMKTAKMRQKLWRMRMAKLADGETFLRAYNNGNRPVPFPVQLDFQVMETDRIDGNSGGKSPRA